MVKLDVKTKSASGVVRVFLCRNVCFFVVEQHFKLFISFASVQRYKKPFICFQDQSLFDNTF